MNVELVQADSGKRLDLVNPRLVVAGYTGRDPAAVARHIEELAGIGVPPPPRVPAFFELDPQLLTTAAVIEVGAPNTSGEVEPVLIRHENRYYLGLGSDHTDRDLERDDVAAAKAVCPKPLCRSVIALPGVVTSLDWDTYTVAAQADGLEYQHDRLSALRRPSDLLDRLRDASGDRGGDLVLYAGTVPLLTGHFLARTHWHLSLAVPASTTLTHSYEVTRRFT